jgi:hypothetical protein
MGRKRRRKGGGIPGIAAVELLSSADNDSMIGTVALHAQKKRTAPCEQRSAMRLGCGCVARSEQRSYHHVGVEDMVLHEATAENNHAWHREGNGVNCMGVDGIVAGGPEATR